MCGIAGIVSVKKDFKVENQWLRKMTNSLIHRGPDDNGIYISGRVGLGNRRLAIIDLSEAGHMPMSGAEGKVWITYNGEIYNFQELRDGLMAKGYTFRSKSDTEVILQSYIEYGLDFLSRLNGMFGMAIWDSRNDRLILARDRLGIKPLYYYWDRTLLVFASELRAIMAVTGLGLDLSTDPSAINQYLIYGDFPAPYTPFRNVRKLLPGQVVVLKGSDLSERPFWEFCYQSADSGEEELLERLDNILTSSVRRRLISDVPVGAFLSGGIDSSCIAAIAAREAGSGFKTFSIGYKDERYDESRYAELVSSYLGTDHQTLLLDDTDITEDIVRIMGGFDEPFYDHSAIPTFFVSQMARKQVTVALSGDGGDELFFGYRHLRQYMEILMNLERLEGGTKSIGDHVALLIPKPLLRFVSYGLRGLIGEHHPFAKRLKIISQYSPGKDWADYFVNYQARVHPVRRCALLAEEGKEDETRFLRNLMVEDNSRTSGERVSAIDLRNYLQNDILVKVDRMSMLNSLEVRVPFLDHTFVEFTGTIPFNLKMKNGQQKYLLRKYLERLYPSPELVEIITRNKQGFRFPLERYIKGPLCDRIRQSLTTDQFLFDLGLRAKAVRREISLFFDHGHGGKSVWMLFCMFLWWERSKGGQEQ